jgi:hypothetical protein
LIELKGERYKYIAGWAVPTKHQKFRISVVGTAHPTPLDAGCWILDACWLKVDGTRPKGMDSIIFFVF